MKYLQYLHVTAKANILHTFGGKKDKRFSPRRLGFSHLVAGEYLDLVVGSGGKSLDQVLQ